MDCNLRKHQQKEKKNTVEVEENIKEAEKSHKTNWKCFWGHNKVKQQLWMCWKAKHANWKHA